MRPRQMYPTIVPMCECGQYAWRAEVAYRRTGSYRVTDEVMTGRDERGGELIGVSWMCDSCGLRPEGGNEGQLTHVLADAMGLENPRTGW